MRTKYKKVFEQRRRDFVTKLQNMLNIEHADSLQLIDIKKNRILLQYQSETG